MASISRRPRKNGTIAWRVQYRDAGNPSPTTATFDSYDAAERFSDLVDRLGGPAARRHVARLEHGSTSPTLDQALEDHLTRSHHITDGTRDDYDRIFDRSGIRAQLGHLPVDLVTDDDVQAWVAARRAAVSERTGDRISPKTIHNEHGLLSTVLAHAVSRGWATTNPARGISLPKVAPPDPLVITREQYTAILDAFDPYYGTDARVGVSLTYPCISPIHRGERARRGLDCQVLNALKSSCSRRNMHPI